MDKFGKAKQMLVAAVAAAGMSLPANLPDMATQEAAKSIEVVANLPESVQDMYRPVMKLARIPDIPRQPGDRSYQWWAEQIKRCRTGWVCPEDKHYLNPYQYFYLNFITIPIQDKKKGKAIWSNPLFRDNDETILSQLWRNTQRVLGNGKTVDAKNHIEAKCRSIGWTQLSLLGVGMWTFIFRPDRAIGIGYPDDDVIATEKQWFATSWAKLPAMLRTWEGRLLKPVYDNAGRFAVGHIDPETKVTHVHNECLFNIIATNAGVFKGLRLQLIIAVEAGKWQGDTLKNFYSENLDCLEMGGQTWGMFLIGGTSNVIINKSTNYKEIYFGCQNFNATRHFSAKYMVMNGYLDEHTGRSDIEGAMKRILEQRKMREGDSQAYQQYIIENPLTDQECFTPNESFAYDTAKILAQVAFVREAGFLDYWRRGTIEPEKDHADQPTARIKFTEDPRGHWLVNLEGLPSPRSKQFKNLHIAGFDDTYKGAEEEKLRKNDSRNCVIVWRQPTLKPINKSDMPCGLYLRQTPDLDDVYEDVLNGLKFWDVMQCLLEYNHDGFVKYLRDRNEGKRLYYVNGKPGLTVRGPRIKRELTDLGHAYFKANRYLSITNVEILESLTNWGSSDNNDIGSTFHLILHLLHATKDHAIHEVMGAAYEESGSGRILLGANNPATAAQYSVSKIMEEMTRMPSGGDVVPETQKKSGRIKLGVDRMGRNVIGQKTRYVDAA